MTRSRQELPKSGRSRPPAYQWYPAEAYADRRYRAMSLEERGAYRELLDSQWLDGPLPLDHDELAALVGVTLEHFEGLWRRVGKCFERRPEGYVNARLAREFERLDTYRAERSDAGKRGAEARWGSKNSPDGSGNGSAMREPLANDSTTAAAATTTAAAAAESTRARPRARACEEDRPSQDQGRVSGGELLPDPSLDPRTWSFASAPKDAAWADWLEHQAQLERPPTEKTLSKHWHRLRDLSDAQATALVSDAISLGARAFTDEITRRALARAAADPATSGGGGGDPARQRIASEAKGWALPPELGGDDFRSAWVTWVDHATGQARPPTEAQLRTQLAALAAEAGGQHGARRAVEYAVGHGLTGFTEGVLRVARDGSVDKATGRVLPGPGSPVTDEERRIMGWD